MRVWVLGSGSRGNAVVIEAGETRILVDAGFAPPVLTRRLASIEIAPASIQAVVVTHEHVDHVRGVKTLARRFDWSVHATAGTVLGCDDLAGAGAFRAGDTIRIGDIDIATARAPHDASEPVVLVATHTRTGARAGIAYDLGIATQGVMELLRDLDVLVVEANHDELMLQHGPYPPSVRARIAGRNGHLGNGAAAQMARELAHRELRHVVLAHLSESCNEPQAAVTTVSTALGHVRYRGRVSVAPQDRVVGPFEPGRRIAPAVQLDFGL